MFFEFIRPDASKTTLFLNLSSVSFFTVFLIQIFVPPQVCAKIISALALVGHDGSLVSPRASHAAEIPPREVVDVDCEQGVACLPGRVVDQEAVVARCPPVRT